MKCQITSIPLVLRFSLILLCGVWNLRCSQSTPQILPPIPPVSNQAPSPSSLSLKTQQDPPATELVPPPPVKDCIGRLLITEFMADPEASADRFGEYVEITNIDYQRISLHHWVLSNGRGQEFRFRQKLELEPGATLVIGGSKNLDLSGDVPIAVEWGAFSLPNQKGLLHLRNPCGDSVDRIRYTHRRPWPKARPGVSLERISASDSHMSQFKQWRPSTQKMVSGDRGTPGKVSPKLFKSMGREAPQKAL